MVAHHRREAGELAPTYEQFLEDRVIDVSLLEAAHVGGEPGDAGHAHMDAAGDLRLEVVERGAHVAAPDQGAVTLGAHPRAAGEVHDVSLASLGQLAFVEAAVVFARVDVAGGDVRAGPVTVVAEIVGAVFGFGLVQPEGVDAMRDVVLAALLPHKGAGLGVGGVIELIGFLVHVRHIDTALGVHQ